MAYLTLSESALLLKHLLCVSSFTFEH